MKYVVSGYIGFDNFGDEAIQRVLINDLKLHGAEKITLISSNPEKTKKIHNVNSCSMLGFIPELMNSDVLISGGGSLLQDVTSLKSLLYYLAVIFTALCLQKKVEIYAQGIGPINSKIGIFLTKLVLKHASKISVRDKTSQELLKSWGIDSELVKDPVLTLDLPHKNIQGTVGIQLRSYKDVDEKFLDYLSEYLINNYPDKNYEVISLQDSLDLNVCNQFMQILLKKGVKNVTLYSNLSLDDVIEKLSSLEYLIAMRFHANVIGIKSGVKTIAINYDPKVKKLADEYNLKTIELIRGN